MFGNKYKDQSSLDLNQVCNAAPRPDATLHMYIAHQRAKTVKQIVFATVLFGGVLLATQLLATPWTDEEGNPNPDCTGSCHETGIPNPPEPPKQSPKPRDDKGNEGSVVQCGCGYVVHLHDGITKADALKACKRKFTELQLQSCSWPDGVNPGDKG